MDFVQRITFYFLAIFISLNVTTKAHADYTPAPKYKQSDGLGGQFADSAQALCDNAKAKITPSNPYQQIISCVTKTQVYNSSNNSVVIVTATLKRNSETSTYVVDVGYHGQWCAPDTRKSGNFPNVICNGAAPPPPCPPSDVFPATYYSHLCVNGCAQKWNGQHFDMLGIKYYGAIGNTGAACAAGTGEGKSMQSAWDENKAAADKAAADKAAADKAAADAAAAAKTAADKAAAAAAAAAAEKAKAAAADAKAAAEKAAAEAEAKANDPNATQQDKDAAAAAAGAAASNAQQKADEAADKAGTAAATQIPDTKPEAKDFCEKNPTSFICKTSAINAGGCTTSGDLIGFQCDGDAVLCASAKTQLSNHCYLTAKDDALVQAFTDAKNDNGSNSPAHSSKITNINLPTSLNQSGQYGAGQCNPDLTISFDSQSVTLPFSAWCPYLEGLGYLFLAMAYLSAAYIIGGRA